MVLTKLKVMKRKLGDADVAAMTYPLIEGAGSFMMSMNMSAKMTAQFTW
jgi:hypothetical protein